MWKTRQTINYEKIKFLPTFCRITFVARETSFRGQRDTTGLSSIGQQRRRRRQQWRENGILHSWQHRRPRLTTRVDDNQAHAFTLMGWCPAAPPAIHFTRPFSARAIARGLVNDHASKREREKDEGIDMKAWKTTMRVSPTSLALVVR